MSSSCLLLSESKKLSSDLAKTLPAEIELVTLAGLPEEADFSAGFAFALVDCRAEGDAGWQGALQALKGADSDDFPVIAICRPDALAAVRRALQGGADNYLFAPLRKAETNRVIEQCLGGVRSAEGAGTELPSDEVLLTEGFCGFIGASELMKGVYRQLLKIAAADSSV
jgi:DNA-binding NtrC family response regulator